MSELFTINLTVNGISYTVYRPRMLLSDFLRHELNPHGRMLAVNIARVAVRC